MGVNIEPSVTLLISELRKVSLQTRKNKGLLELKRMAARNPISEESILIDLWKKLYLQSLGFRINILDFIKACGSNNILIKRIGYQGVIVNQPLKELIILQNTIQKDLENADFCSEALIFVSNINDSEEILKDIVSKLALPSENMKHYRKILIMKAKYCDSQFFELRSENELNLFVKLQILLDNEKFSYCSAHYTEYLVNCLKRLKCQYTKLKILQILQKMVKCYNITFNEASVLKIRSFIFSLNVKSRKQIEIGICIESIRLLLLSGNRYEELDEFIFTLINSKSLNSNYLGLNLAVQFKLNPEITISKIIEVGIDRDLFFNSLYKLIDTNTYMYVYQHLDFVKEVDPSNVEAKMKRERNIMSIIKRICDFGDHEFICNVLYKHPKIYPIIRNEKLIKPEQCKSFFKMLLEENNPNYYLMIYDLFPSKTNSDCLVLDIARRHLTNLIELNEENVADCLDSLFTFLCLQGNAFNNRQECLNILKDLSLSKMNLKVLNVIIEGIQRFNLVLDSKLVYYEFFKFLKYQVMNSELIITYSQDFPITASLKVPNAVWKSKKTEKDQVIECYEIVNTCEIEVKSSLGTVNKSIKI